MKIASLIDCEMGVNPSTPAYTHIHDNIML